MVAVITFKGRQRSAGTGSKMDYIVATVVIKCRVSFTELEGNSKVSSDAER